MEEHRPLGWTTLEESKRLVEAGLDPNTADMSYNFVVCKVTNGNPSEDWLMQPFPPDENQPHEQNPCWSLGALIGLMPKTIPHKRNKEKGKEYWNYSLLITPNTVYYGCHIIDSHFYLYDDLVDFKYDNCIVEAAVNTVCWLLKNGYIKKQE